MTIGLCLSNSKESFVLTDKAFTTIQEQGYIGNKLGSQSTEKFNALYAMSGNYGNLVNLLVERKIDCETFDDFKNSFLEIVNDFFNDLILSKYHAKRDYVLDLKKGQVQRKPSKQLTITSNIIKKLYSFYGLMSVSIENELRTFNFDSEGFTPTNVCTLHKIGSGTTFARSYLNNFMSGLEISSLSNTELLFHIMCAYNLASATTTVGGTPEVQSLDLEGNIHSYSLDQRCAMSNVAAAYLTHLINKPQVSWMFEAIFEKKDYSDISRILNLTTTTLTTTTIPFLSWQERANHI